MTKETKSKKTKPPKVNYKRKAVGLIIGLIGIFLLIFIIFYSISRIFRAEDFARMLPQDTTLGLVQINVNAGHEQVQRFFTSLSDYEIYHPDKLTALVDGMLETDFESDIAPWLNRQVGFAFLEQKESPGEMEIVIFVEVKNKDAAIDFMQSRGLQGQEDYVLSDEYNGKDIYRYALSQAYHFTFINNYMIVAMNDGEIKQIIDSSQGNKIKLADDSSYQKVKQNLPINTLVFTYVNFEKILEFLKENDEFMSEKGRQLLAFEPFLRLYKSFGTSMIMQNGDFAVQTFTLLDEDYLEEGNIISFDTKFRAELLSLMPNDIVFYAGGLNLKEQMHRYGQLFSTGGEVSYLIFEGMIRAQKNHYIGEEITLEEDIYPLLQGEYAFAISKTDDKSAVTIMLELEDPLQDRDKVESIADSFMRKSAILAPKVVEVELEDGTILEEIQTVPEEILRSTEDYHGYEMNILTVGNAPWGIYYIIADNTLVIATQKEQLKRSIDLVIDEQQSLKNSSLFNGTISPVLRNSDEVMFANFNYLFSAINDGSLDWISPYLEPFSYFSAGKNYFNDGISTIQYIKIE
jgi:hypothetical protein